MDRVSVVKLECKQAAALGEYRNFLLRYRAEFPIEFLLVSGNSIGNSALYRTCTVAGNSYIVPVLAAAGFLDT